MLWFYSLRELGRRRGRTLLTLAGIVLGVAAIVSVSTVVSATKEAYRDMFAAVSGEAELEVVAPGAGDIDPALAGRLEQVEGVEAAVPVVQSPGALVTDEARTVVIVLGVDPVADERARTYVLESGQSFLGESWNGSGTPVLMERGFAESQGLAAGDTARLVTTSGTVEATVLGLIDARGAAAFNGGAVLFTPLERAQELFDLPGRVNSIQLVLADGAGVEAVREAVAAELPPGLSVRSPAARGEIAEETLFATEQGLDVLAALSMVAAVFIVVNAFVMSFTERRRELALMRAVGATRRQVVRLVLREAVLLGLLGTGAGLLLGLAGSYLLTLAMEQQLGVELGSLGLSPGPFVAAGLLGLVASTLSAYLPARRAGRVSPLEGLTEEAEPTSRARRRGTTALGLLLLGFVVVVVAGLSGGWLPAGLTAPAMVALLLGFVLLLPAVLGPLTRAVSRVLSPVMGTSGPMAFRQLDRHPTRTTLTVGVLFVAVTIAISMGNSMLTNIGDVKDWYERTIDADYFVRAALPEVGTNLTAAMPTELGDEIAASDAVAGVEALTFTPTQVEGMQAVVLARTFEPDRPLPLDLNSGTPQEVFEGLRRGGVVLGTLLASRLDADVGDEVLVDTVDGPRELPVVGTATEYTGGGASLYMGWETAQQLLGVRGVDVFMVRAENGRGAQAAADLEALTEPRGLMLQSFAEFRQFIDDMVAGTMAFLWMLLVLIFLVAAIGIVNTLTMNVVEQTRELGLLRAVAMTRRQLRRFILSQAFALGAISLVPGVVAGVAVAALLNRTTAAIAGQAVDFSLDPLLVVGAPVAALVLTVAAAYLPARRAERLSVVEALQFE